MLDNKKNIAIEALTELAADQGGKSEIAKLREIIDHIELTLASGVSHAKVHETLKATLGIRMSLGTFEKNLHLIRKKRKNTPFKEMAKKNEEIESGSKQLSAVPTIVTKAIETNTEGSKKQG